MSYTTIFNSQYTVKRQRTPPARGARSEEEGEAAQNNVVMSAGKRSCPDIICYLSSVILWLRRISDNVCVLVCACGVQNICAVRLEYVGRAFRSVQG